MLKILSTCKTSGLVGLILIGVLITSSCSVLSSVSSTTASKPDNPNHVINLYNGGSNTSEAAPRQFTYMTVTPIDSPESQTGYSFVSNPAEMNKINVYIPQSGFYKIRIYLWKDGPSIWWDQFALAVDGQTTIGVNTNNMGFMDNSNANTIRPSGNDIPLK